MILLWGLPGDSPLAWVAARLAELGAEVVMLDQRLIAQTTATIELAPRLAGEIVVDGVAVADLSEVTGAYLRPYDSRRLIARIADADGAVLRRSRQTDMALLAWADVAAARVVNRPSAMISNDSKPFQARLIERVGFRTPPTLLTNDIAALERFRERHGELIYKSTGSTRSIVSRLRTEHLARLGNLRCCPTQFQRYVPGTDYRVHVLGDAVFAARVRCDADDYRYATRSGDALDVCAADLPDSVARRCLRLAADLGLAFAGIDLRRTDADEWYCFEVNPSPGYSFYQQRTGVALDLALARHLAGVG